MTGDLVSALSKRKDVALTVSLSRQMEGMVDNKPDNYSVYHVDTFRSRMSIVPALIRLRSQTRGLIQFAEDHDVEVLFAIMRHPFAPFVFHSFRRQNRRVLLAVHDAFPHPGDSFPFWRSHFRLELGATDGIVVMSKTVAELMSEIYGYPTDRIFSMPLPAPIFSGAAAVRQAPKDRPWRLMFFGRIREYKGLDLLSDAYEILRHRFSVSLRIIGQGDVPALRRLAKQPMVSIEQGWIPEQEVPSMLAEADILVLPYVEASQSGVLMSAFAAGVPAVVTPVGGILEQIQSGKDGLLAKEVTAVSLADAIAALISNPQLYTDCSAGALASARQKFGSLQAAEAIVKAASAIKDMPQRSSRK